MYKVLYIYDYNFFTYIYLISFVLIASKEYIIFCQLYDIFEYVGLKFKAFLEFIISLNFNPMKIVSTFSTGLVKD